jgi:hypothetical protein
MFTSIDKALVALILAVLSLLTTSGIQVPEFLNQDWVTTAVTAITPLLVWLFPNKPKRSIYEIS